MISHFIVLDFVFLLSWFFELYHSFIRSGARLLIYRRFFSVRDEGFDQYITNYAEEYDKKKHKHDLPFDTQFESPQGAIDLGHKYLAISKTSNLDIYLERLPVPKYFSK